jgi:hypothetical protein
LPESKGTDSKTNAPIPAGERVPFPVGTSDGRKYVRLELSSPVEFHVLTLSGGKLKLSRKRSNAEILNLSQGGMLLATDSPVPSDGFMILTLNLNGLVVLDGVLGKIKRVEPSGEGDFLVGLQFAAEAELEKLVSAEEIRRLPMKVTSFKHKISQIISSYLRTAELTAK